MPAPEPGLVARGVIDRVIDGDTVDVLITIPVRVRLLDCWAPEIRGGEKDDGLIAKSLMENMAPKGASVRVHVPTGQVDAMLGVLSFGRVLGQIWRDGDDESLAEMLVATGAATREKQ
jgi:endonuclease YncB( thermonuclease family)